MNNEIYQPPQALNFAEETKHQQTSVQTKKESKGFIFALISFVAGLIAYVFYLPIIYMYFTGKQLYFLQNIDLTPYVGIIALCISIIGIVVLIKNFGKGYGYIRSFLPLTFILQFSLIMMPLVQLSLIKYSFLAAAITSIFGLFFSIIVIYRNYKTIGIILALSLISATAWIIINNHQIKKDMEINAGYGSKTDIHSMKGLQKVSTKFGTVYFELSENVDYESWGNSNTGLGIVFTEKGKGSGTLYGGCGAGSSFIEAIEQEDTHYNDGFKLNERKEIYGENTYLVYDWKIEPSITYYELPYKNTVIQVVYRPNELCIKGKKYKSDLELLLKTLKYEGSQKADISQ